MKKRYVSLILILSCLVISLTACAEKKEPIKTEHLELIIENLLKPLTEKEYTEFQEIQSGQSSLAMEDWLEKRFENHMTKEAYNNFLATATYEVMVRAYETGSVMKAKDLHIEKKDDYHEITGKIVVQHSDKTEETFDLQGTGQLDENGLVSYFSINAFGELNEMVMRSTTY